MKGTTKEQRRKKNYAWKDLPTLTRVKRKRVNNSPIEKPHLKNIEQTSQNGYYVEMKRLQTKRDPISLTKKALRIGQMTVLFLL